MRRIALASSRLLLDCRLTQRTLFGGNLKYIRYAPGLNIFTNTEQIYNSTQFFWLGVLSFNKLVLFFFSLSALYIKYIHIYIF